MTVALLLASGLVPSGAEAASPTPLRPAANNAATIRSAATVLLVICTTIFVVVEVLLLTSIIRFRGRREEDASTSEGNRNLETAWTVIPFLIVTVLFVITFTTMRRLQPPGRQTTLTATGHQWWWQFEYGPSTVTANEMHLPIGAPVRIALKSADVIHSFWVPQLAGKTDMSPGRTTFTGFTAQKPGWYLGECSEFCGAQHAHMRFWVKIETPEEYDAWLRLQQAPAGQPAPGDATKGRDLFLAKPCVGCHTIRGTTAAGTIGPDLTHVGGRRSLAAGTLNMTPSDVASWVLDPQAIKPGALMPIVGVTPDEARLLAAYLTGLR